MYYRMTPRPQSTHLEEAPKDKASNDESQLWLGARLLRWMSGSSEDNNPYVQQSGEECVRSPASTTASTSLQANINKRRDREGETSKLVLLDLPPSARQSLPPRVRREYRQQMIQMDVENNNNAVILGSTDKAHGNMELEWGNAI